MFTITKNTTKQELFDETVRHLKEQKYRAATFNNLGPLCAYRHNINDNVYKCAIGNFIPDSEYDADMEGATAGTLFMDYTTCLNKLSFDDPKGFLIDLQSAHDTTDSGGWQNSLLKCATRHGLDFDWESFPQELPLGDSIDL